MKIQCPKCNTTLLPEQINVTTDFAFCSACNEGFKLSTCVDRDAVNSDVLGNPPNGAWFRREMDTCVLGATTRSPIAFFLVPFMCVWSGGSVGSIYGSQIAKGVFDPGLSLVGIPFLIGSIIFWSLALMAICGKVELKLSNVKRSSVLIGIGSLGWTQYFDWRSIQNIREENAAVRYPGGNQGVIFLEGKNRVVFGMGLNESRKYFLLNALKYLKAENR